MPLTRHRDPFDHPDFLFELKYDGFRALAYIDGECSLISRNQRPLKRFDSLSSDIATNVKRPAVLDGEIVYLDANGCAQFYELLKRDTEPVFVAFDVLNVDGRDLCRSPLIGRKRVLEELIPSNARRMLVARHIEERGVDFFRLVCDRDLEGIVAKRRDGLYAPDRSDWLKIKNAGYSQAVGRWELFERRNAKGAGR